MTTTIVIVDDQPIVRAGFATILDAYEKFEVIGEAADGEEAIEVVRSLRPDVVLMDIRMPRLDGISAMRRLTSADLTPPARILMLTTFDLDEYVYEALRAGASGFLLKDATRDELIHAVQVVADGDALLAPRVTKRLIAEFLQRPQRPTSPTHLDTLTPREHEVLLQVARGRSNAEIAADMYLGESTVKTHVGHVLMKLALRDRVQAVILAYEHGLITPGGSGP